MDSILEIPKEQRAYLSDGVRIKEPKKVHWFYRLIDRHTVFEFDEDGFLTLSRRYRWGKWKRLIRLC